MHEMTLAISAIKSVIEFAGDNGIDEIDTVVLEIGELSLVVPQYMEDAFYAAVPGTMLEHTKLRMDIVPGNGVCRECGRVYNIIEHRGRCPRCGSESKDILSGEEFNIKELLVPEDGPD